MIPLREVPVLDGNAEALGVPTSTLMENAGRAVADHVRRTTGDGTVYVLAGPGNNGGDGLVAAAHLARDLHVVVLTPVEGGGFKTQLARDAFVALPDDVEVVQGADAAVARERLQAPGVIVDALLGAGVRGPPRGRVGELVDAANASGLRVFSVDAPTGFGSEKAVEAVETITLHDVKEGMTESTSGRITVVDIGIPEEAATHVGPGEFHLYPTPSPSQHKGMGGVVLTIGGGPYTGAPAITGLAALRTGADLSILLVPERAWKVVAGYSPNLVVRPLNHDDLNLEDPPNRVALNAWLKKADSVVIGPGLGLYNVTKESVRHAVERADGEGVPVVADADAITALAEKPETLGPNMVVTPHAREFQTLTGEELPDADDLPGRAALAKKHALKTGATFLVKGPTDVITDGQRTKFNRGGHPYMSVGGTGDALAGIVGCLLAKGLPPFDAARLGSYINARAGEVGVAVKGPGFVATDLVDHLPAVMQEGLGRVHRG